MVKIKAMSERICSRAIVHGDFVICMAPGGPQGSTKDVCGNGCGNTLQDECNSLAERQRIIREGGKDPKKGEHPDYGKPGFAKPSQRQLIDKIRLPKKFRNVLTFHIFFLFLAPLFSFFFPRH